MKKIATILLLMNVLVFAQNLKIVKILDTNLFELNDGQKVKLYGLNVPSVNETDTTLQKIADEILTWEKRTFLESNFEIVFVDTIKEVKTIKLFKKGAGNDIDVATWFLANGLATITADNKDAKVLLPIENKAKAEEKRIWKNSVKSESLEKLVPREKLRLLNVKYEHPYLYMLAASIASAALAWDNFAQASEIQDEINTMNNLAKATRTSFDSSKLDNAKFRKSIVGGICVVASILTTVFAVQSVEVRNVDDRVVLSYRF